MNTARRQYLSITDVLERWGRSRKINDAYSIGFPHATSTERAITGKGRNTEGLPCEDHQLVDAAISELNTRGGLRHKVLCMYYVDGKHDKMIAEKLRMSRSKAREVRIAAEAWVEAKIPPSYWLE